MNLKKIKEKVIDFLFEKSEINQPNLEKQSEIKPPKKVEILSLEEMSESNERMQEQEDLNEQKKEDEEIIFEKEKRRIMSASHLTPEEKEEIISELYDDFKNYESNN